jgi:hypothetical protein
MKTGVEFEVGVFQDDAWELIESGRLKDASCFEKREKALQIIKTAVYPQGGWYVVPTTKIYSANRPHIYYFAQMDCYENFQNAFSYNPAFTPRVEVKLTMRNEDGDHFTHEKGGVGAIQTFLLMV